MEKEQEFFFLICWVSIAIIQMKGNSGLNPRGECRGYKDRSDHRHILKTEWTVFSKGVDMIYRRNKRIKDDSNISTYATERILLIVIVIGKYERSQVAGSREQHKFNLGHIIFEMSFHPPGIYIE